MIETLSQIHVLFETMMLLTMQETKVLKFEHRVDKKQRSVEQTVLNLPRMGPFPDLSPWFSLLFLRDEGVTMVLTKRFHGKHSVGAQDIRYNFDNMIYRYEID